MGDNSLDNRNYTDLPKKIVNKSNKKGYRKTIFLLITIAFLFTGVVITSLIVLKLKEKAPVKPPKPKAGKIIKNCWCTNRDQCVQSLGEGAWHGDVGEGYCSVEGDRCCGNVEYEPEAPSGVEQCTITYDDNRCFTVVHCKDGQLQGFHKPYSGTSRTTDRGVCSTTDNPESVSTVPDNAPHTYCADPQPCQCRQFDHHFSGIGPNGDIVNAGGVCECAPCPTSPTPSATPTATPTPTHTPTATPTATATPTSTPTATPTDTPTATPTGTPPPSSTPTATNTPPPAASNTPTPTEIVLAQASATVEPTIPSAGKTAPWIIAALPIMIVILGLLL